MYTDSNQSNMYLTAKGESEEITLEVSIFAFGMIKYTH